MAASGTVDAALASLLTGYGATSSQALAADLGQGRQTITVVRNLAAETRFERGRVDTSPSGFQPTDHPIGPRGA